jgi:membrane protein
MTRRVDDGWGYLEGEIAVTPDPAPPVSNTLPPSAVRHIARRPPRMSAKQIWGLVRASFAAWGEDYASSMGAALSFYTVFSVAPVLLIAIAVAGLVFDTHAAQRAVVSELTGLMGREAAAAVEALLQSARSPSGGVISTTVGVVVLLIGASAVFGELQDALNRIWRAPVPRPPGLWRLVTERLLSFGMILGVGFLLIVSLVVSAAIAAFGQWWGDAFSYQALVLEVINFVLSVGVITLAFALIYKLIPHVSVQWHDVWIGAAVTALLFTVGKSLIGFYLGKTGVASAFGAAGSLIVLLLWVYYSAQIFLLGAEFTWVYAHAFGSYRERPQPAPPSAVPRHAPAAPQETPILVKPWSGGLAAERRARRPPGATPLS